MVPLSSSLNLLAAWLGPACCVLVVGGPGQCRKLLLRLKLLTGAGRRKGSWGPKLQLELLQGNDSSIKHQDQPQ